MSAYSLAPMKTCASAGSGLFLQCKFYVFGS
jgi:hypothetical protein